MSLKIKKTEYSGAQEGDFRRFLKKGGVKLYQCTLGYSESGLVIQVGCSTLTVLFPAEKIMVHKNDRVKFFNTGDEIGRTYYQCSKARR